MNIRLKTSKIALFFVLLLGLITSFCLMTAKAETNNNLSLNDTETVVRNSNGQLNEFISVFSFTPISETECDVRLSDKTATRAIVPEKVELNGKEYTVTVIAANGFTSATKLEMVRLPKSIKTIGANAFVNCKGLTSLTLPAVETIGANAFAMTKMEYLIIPTTVTSVASTILRGTNTQVYVRAALAEGASTPDGWVSNWNGSNKNQNVEYNSSFVPEVKYEFVSSEVAPLAVGDGVELKTGGYYVTGFQEFCTIDSEDYKEVYIPATYTGADGIEYPVIGISEFAFCDTFIDKVTIGYSEQPINISSSAFITHMGSVITFNRNVTFEAEDWEGNPTTSDSVFCSSTVSTIILPKNIDKIGVSMFDGCENLRDVHFVEPDGTLSPNAEANINLKLPSTQKVELLNTITYIGDSAFNLTKNILELYIPNSVTNVGSNIISGWTSNQTVNVDFVADDPVLQNWNENWAFESGEDKANIVYKISDNSYQITYNIGKEYHNNPDSYISSEGLSLLPVEKAGYTFAGWYLDESFTKPIESIAIGTAGDLTLYAKLVGNEYTIMYEKNCPAIASNPVLGDMDSSTHIYSVESLINPNKYTLKGWTFVGWNTKADGTGTSYLDKAAVTTFVESGTGKLYAQWKQKEYKLNYIGNRPNNATSRLEGNMLEETHLYEDTFNLQKIAYTIEGWTFVGWNTKADGTGITYKDEEIVKNLDEKEISLYAQWEVSTYNVIYDKNTPAKTEFEVQGVMDSSTHIYDNPSFLRTNVYTLEGWHFVGWNTKADGSGTSYVNGAEVTTLTSSGSIKLYAQWVANTYTIIYQSNRPNSSNPVLGETANSIHTVDEAGILSSNGYTIKGWNFVGWNTKADGSGTAYNNKENVKNVTTSLSNIELYAQWEAKSYSVEYESNTPATASNSVQGTTGSSNHIADTASALTSNGYTLKGWTFAGWNTKADCSGTTYADNSSIQVATDESIVKLYAQWVANTYTILYVQNRPNIASHEVLGDMSSSTHTYDTASSLRTNVYTLEGWHFVGWNTKADGSGISYVNGAEVITETPSGELRLYAQWKQNKFTIVYASNGGTGNMADTIVYYDTPAKLTTNTFMYTGKHFSKWTGVVNGIEMNFEDMAEIKNITSQDGDKILLSALWDLNDYYIRYNSNQPNNNRPISGEMNISIHENYVPRQLSKNAFSFYGWTFTGWNTKADGSGTSYADEAEVLNLTYENGVTVDLYAQWKASTYTIVYDANLPMENSIRTDQNPSFTVHTYDTASNINQFYTLVSWEMTGWLYNGTTYSSGAEIINLSANGGSVTLQAQWKSKENVLDCRNSSGIYEIVSVKQLEGISQGSYKLMCDLTIDSNWKAITEFTGELDLNGKTITYQNNCLDSNSNYGFILINKGTIKNGYFKPNIVQPSVNTLQQNEVYIGGVVSQNYGTISDIQVLSLIGKDKDDMDENTTKTDINARSHNCVIGGFAGINYGTIQSCKNYASLGGSYYIGGIVGKNMSAATIDNCTNEGQIWFCLIVEGRKCVGGIAAANYANAEIKNCSSYGLIVFAFKTTTNTSTEVYMASIVGWGNTSGVVSNYKILTNPIEIRVTGLTNVQLSYIKSNGESIGKETNEPDPAHVHLYSYVPKSSGHTGICSCGYIITSLHVIRSVDANKDEADCIYCKASVNLKRDRFIVEFGPTPDFGPLNATCPLNQISQIKNINYEPVENYMSSNEKELEVDCQD